MSNNKQRIMTIDAKKFFSYCAKKPGEEKEVFCFNTTKRILYAQVVSRENMMEDCPLFYQFIDVVKEVDKIEEEDCDFNLLYDKLVVMDFDDIFLPIDEEKMTEQAKKRKEQQLEDAKDIIENGFKLHFEGKDIIMRPFDKSGNMSRKGRITFVAEKYVAVLNERLNLGIDFSRLPVLLSKYYAYRGLYLSSSKRVDSEDIKITPETLVIVKDQRLTEKARTRGANKGERVPVAGPAFERDVKIMTAKDGEKTGNWEITEPKEEPLEINKIPYDGEGVVVPSFADNINDTLGIDGATSFQIRLPFAKGMIHKVDVVSFLDEFTINGDKEGEYWYEDAFGHKRDLRKAKLLITESMFKGKKWLEKYCETKRQDEPENEAYKDPMIYYCNKLNEYKHALYVSGTNVPFGHSYYTHLSYQAINTIAFADEQFENVIEKHRGFIAEPVRFLKDWKEIERGADKGNETKMMITTPNWKKAVIKNEIWKNDIYIKEQLNNIRKGLLTKVATGKILVEGQIRYLCRDLLPLLAGLLNDDVDINGFHRRYLYKRFYMPFDVIDESEKKRIKLEPLEHYAFFRNPHLSRNEQCIMKPFVPVSKDEYEENGKTYDKYMKHIKMYDKYFGHLTGVVMFPRGSIAPLCLGGADFDGDLVSVIFDQNIVDAIKTSTYEEEEKMKNWWERKLPTVKIPDVTGVEETVPSYVPYKHIYDTFSNRIGQISNAAISIGQEEYKKSGGSTEGFSATKPTCDKCTLLTGLEIDAAKNGIHPNLDIILKGKNTKCAYLRFLDKYKKLKSERFFRVGNIKVEKEEVLSKEQIRVSASGCKTVAKFNIQDNGTYVNQLPVVFYDCFHQDKKDDDGVAIDVDKYIDKQTKENKEVKRFIKECKAVFDMYFFYKKIFFRDLTKEKNKGFYAIENMETLIDQMYDKYEAERIQLNIMPALRDKLEKAIGIDADIKVIKKRLDEYQWQFQPVDRRLITLERIIGNDFKSETLTEEEKKLLCHFNHQGYKMLYLLLEVIEGPRRELFDIIKERISEKRNKHIKTAIKELEENIEEVMRQYYDNNAEGASDILYELCLEKIKEIIGRYTKSIGKTSIIYVLYKATENKSNSDNRRFFWDAFEWEELEAFVKKG